MQSVPGIAQEVSTAKEIGPVIHVAPVGRAAPGADDSGPSEFGQVVRDQVLWLAHQLDEFTDAPIAAPELADQLPSQRLAEQPEDLRCPVRWHPPIISSRIDGIKEVSGPAHARTRWSRALSEVPDRLRCHQTRYGRERGLWRAPQ